MKRSIQSLSVVTVVMFATLRSASAADEPRRVDREPANDTEFVVKAISCEIAEVKLAEQVKKQTQNPEVQKIAATMITDHSKLRDALIERARAMKVAVVEGTEPEYRDREKKFSQFSGAELDQEYARHLVDSHNQTIRVYESWLNKTKDKDIVKYIEDSLPVLREHKKRAEQLVANLKK